MKSSLFILILLYVGATISATNLPADITVNTTLTKENSPYILTNATTVNTGITLTINAGAIIKLPESGKITINGSLIVSGTASEPVLFTAIEANKDWECIYITKGNAQISFLKTENAFRFISIGECDWVTISNCTISSTAFGNGNDCIIAHDSKKVVIDNCTITGAGGKIADGVKNDGIDLDNIDSIRVSNNVISKFADDGIDIGTESGFADIFANNISNCNFGVSIGEKSVGVVSNNVLSYNDAGLQVHTEANVKCISNTLYKNKFGIKSYHYDEDPIESGGIVEIINTIFYDSDTSDIIAQSNSVVTVSYSISNKAALNGVHNLKADPLFTNAASGDFSLQANSPCLNSGKPDANNNPTTMGSAPESDPVLVESTKMPTIIGIYPNPAANSISLQLYNNESIVNIKIYSFQGNLISNCSLKSFSHFDVSHLKAGLYFVSCISNNKNIYSGCFVKQ